MKPQIEAAVQRLEAARRQRQTVEPLGLAGQGLVLDDAYAVQRLHAARRAVTDPVAGRKVAMTSLAVQQPFGISFPTAGPLHQDAVWLDGAVIPFASLLQPKVEAEIAFVLRSDLDMPRPSYPQVLQAVDFALVAIEVAECRIAGWQVDAIDFVADSSAAGHVVLGDTPFDVRGIDLRALPMEMTINDQVRSSGQGRNCLGNPLRSLAWLACFAADAGEPLRRGELVMAGSLGPAAPVRAGEIVRVQIGHLPAVRVEFADGR